jgi:hypothetical protein
MSFLLSLVTTKSSQEFTEILCYYINDTSNIQIIRAISGGLCYFERVVFSKERILFTAFPEAYLEINSSSINGTQSNKIDCKLLRVDQKSKQTESHRLADQIRSSISE